MRLRVVALSTGGADGSLEPKGFSPARVVAMPRGCDVGSVSCAAGSR